MLCDQYVPTFERVGPLENPTFPTSDKPDAYMTVPAITGLVKEALEFWGEPTDVLDVLKVSITRATTRHGAFSLRVSKANMQRASDLIKAMPPDVRRNKVKQMAALQAENVYDMALKFSRDSLEHMPLEERISTIIHEAAHLVDFMRNGRGEGDGHGPTWAALMIEAGEKPTKTAAGAETMMASAKCDCKTHKVPIPMAAEMMARQSLGDPSQQYRCVECRGPFRDVEPPVATDARRRFDMAFRKKKAELQAKQKQRALAEIMRRPAVVPTAAENAALDAGYANVFEYRLRDALRRSEAEKNAERSFDILRLALGAVPPDALVILRRRPMNAVVAIEDRINKLKFLLE